MKKSSQDLLRQIKSNYQEPFFIGYNMLIESLKHKDYQSHWDLHNYI